MRFALLPVAVLYARSALAVALWAQCGGTDYSGDVTCDSGTVCVPVSDAYSQCQESPNEAVTESPRAVAAVPPTGYTQVTNFGTNPSNVGIYAYVPSGLSASPGLVVALHYCTGSASAYYSGTQWKNIADQKKNFIVIYGDSPRSGKCWDVSTSPSLKHNGGSDSLGIASAVRYALSNWGVNSSKVFATGSSSGAMMANVLAGAYPDLFKAAAASAGVPYGCFATTDGSMWNSACANGQITKSGSDWANLVRSAYSGYTGSYPKIFLVHGTADTTLNYVNFQEEIKEWTSVWGVSSTPSSTVNNDPSNGVTHTSYGGGSITAYSVAGGGHGVPIYESQQAAFFGL